MIPGNPRDPACRDRLNEAFHQIERGKDFETAEPNARIERHGR